MILSLVITSLAVYVLGQGFTPAPIINNNPPVTYIATLLDNPSTSTRGNVTVTGAPGGVGVVISAHFTGLPPDLGPNPYHVHLNPVPPSGDCIAAGGHLDPYNRGDQPPCDPAEPATCQIGDLSGKHGTASGSDFISEYTDLYLSTDPGSNAFVGDRSIVIHAPDGTRLNCGNFQFVSAPQAEALNVAVSYWSTRTSSTHTSTRTTSTRPTSTGTSSRSTSTRPTSTGTSSSRSTSKGTTTTVTSSRSIGTSSTRSTSTGTSSRSTGASSTRSTSTGTTSTRSTSTRSTSTGTSSTSSTSKRTTTTGPTPTTKSSFTTRPRTSTSSHY